MKKVLVTGSLGQIGTELVSTLRSRYGDDQVVASDIKMPPAKQAYKGPFEFVDCTNQGQLQDAIQRNNVGTIYHLAALLSAVAEQKPHVAWDINMRGLYAVLEAARTNGCSVFFPSSIGAFGPSTPKVGTPQDTIQRPTTMYGVTKAAGELLCDYYFTRFGVDTRGVRFPGLISHVAMPGGGTTDYAVEIFYEAIRHGSYTCFLSPKTRLDMMYMPDAIHASVSLMEADASRLEHRNSFNVTATNFTPEELAAEIQKHLPKFTVDYRIDPVRQEIADSWPDALDDSVARLEWDWQPSYDLAAMTQDMLEKLEKKLARGET